VVLQYNCADPISRTDVVVGWLRMHRRDGAVPATVAVLAGELVVGLTADEIEQIAKDGPAVAKVSRRDLARVISSGRSGATTVSGTIVACELAGIKIFATGGIGGVHRGAETSFDESADLVEMARSSTCVVCAGAKSILDIGKTLERLETLGVVVVTLGQEEFPAFYSRSSGLRSPHTAKEVDEIAKALTVADQLQLKSGTLVAVPVPEEFAVDAARAESAIKLALEDAQVKGIVGAKTTPFLLSRIVGLTGGQALATNQKLAENNASVAARLAVSYCRNAGGRAVVQRKGGPARVEQDSCEVAVVGATIIDVYSQPFASQTGLIKGTSNPGKVRSGLGGVGRNIAVALARLGCTSCAFVTAVGSDNAGLEAIADLDRAGVAIDHVVQRDGVRTATYVAVHGHEGDLNVAIADTNVYDTPLLNRQTRAEDVLGGARFIVMDANLHDSDIRLVADICRRDRIQLFFEPTSVPKCSRILKLGRLDVVSWTFPGEAEAIEMAMAAAGRRIQSAEEGAEVLLGLGVARVVVTRGKRGATLFRRGNSQHVHVDAEKIEAVKNTSGAGDVLTAAVVYAVSRGLDDVSALKFAVKVAAQSVQSHDAVPSALRARL